MSAFGIGFVVGSCVGIGAAALGMIGVLLGTGAKRHRWHE